MDRVKIQEIASEAGASNAVLIVKAKELGYDVKAGNSTLTIEEAGILADYVMKGIKPKKEEKPKVKRKVTVKKHAGIVSTPKKAKISIREVKKETPKIVEPVKRGSKIKILNRKEEIKQEVIPKIAEEKKEIKAKEEIKPKKIEKIEEKSKEKPKEESKAVKRIRVKRKRVGITVIKKADKQKSKIRIVDDRKAKKEANIVKKSKPKGMPTPPSKKKTKRVAQAKESGQKLNFMSNSSFGSGRSSVTEIEEEPEVMMLDFSDKNIYEDMMRQEQKRKEEAKKRAALGIGQNHGRGQGQYRRKPSGLRRGGKRKRYVKEEGEEQIKSVKIPENVRVYEFAEKIGKSTGEVIRVLFTLGSMFTQNDFLDKDSIEILAEEFNIEVTTIDP